MPRTRPEWIGRTDDAMPPPTVRLRILLAHDGRCAECRNKIVAGKPWQLDHVKPLWDGGENRESNLQPLCDICHGAKTTREASQRAEGKRVRGKHLGVKKPPKRRLPGSRASGWRAKIGGTWERRDG